MVNRIRRAVGKGRGSYVLIVFLAVVVGLTLAWIAWSTLVAPGGTVAVVPVEGTIDGETSAEYAELMVRVREDPTIDAVVVVSNSGGGGASSSEEMYLQTKRTADETPVVASVDAAAASGAYYTIAPADRIVVKPSSIVGSVGVLAVLPRDLEPNNVVATTGPNKLSGADQREFYYLLDSLQQAFLESVFEQRGEALSLTRTELAQARIYSGSQAVQRGLADEVGGREAALHQAARMAGLEEYRVKVLRPNRTARFVSQNNYLASSSDSKRVVPASRLIGNNSTPTFLMVPESYVAGALTNRSLLDTSGLAGNPDDPGNATERATGAGN